MRATPFTDEDLNRIGDGDVTDQFGNSDKTIAVFLAQEVLYQRQWMAYVARVIEAQTLDLKILAKCRRTSLEKTVGWLRDIARGNYVREHIRGLESEYRSVVDPQEAKPK